MSCGSRLQDLTELYSVNCEARRVMQPRGKYLAFPPNVSASQRQDWTKGKCGGSRRHSGYRGRSGALKPDAPYARLPRGGCIAGPPAACGFYVATGARGPLARVPQNGPATSGQNVARGPLALGSMEQYGSAPRMRGTFRVSYLRHGAHTAQNVSNPLAMQSAYSPSVPGARLTPMNRISLRVPFSRCSAPKRLLCPAAQRLYSVSIIRVAGELVPELSRSR